MQPSKKKKIDFMFNMLLKHIDYFDDLDDLDKKEAIGKTYLLCIMSRKRKLIAEKEYLEARRNMECS